MSERFYINWPLQPGPVYLEGPEAHHLAVVCRVRQGDVVSLFNGDGVEYPARVVEVQRRHVVLELAAAQAPCRELGFTLEVAAPLPRGDRAQFLIEKLTELGVTTFVPLACQRSVVHPREGKQEKLERYVIEASKQCGRNVLMQIAPLTPWTDYCASSPEALNILAHPGNATQEFPAAINQATRLAVGPEGGFTDEEVDVARSSGWKLASLGPRILRIETAAMTLAVLATQKRL